MLHIYAIVWKILFYIKQHLLCDSLAHPEIYLSQSLGKRTSHNDVGGLFCRVSYVVIGNAAISASIF